MLIGVKTLFISQPIDMLKPTTSIDHLNSENAMIDEEEAAKKELSLII